MRDTLRGYRSYGQGPLTPVVSARNARYNGRRMPRVRGIGVGRAVSLCLAALVVCGVAAAAGSTALRPAKLSSGSGWHVGNGPIKACPGQVRSQCSQVTSYAATTSWRDCANCVPPHKTLAALPADGIAIQLQLARDSRSPPETTMPWPPKIKPREVIGPFEGAPKRIGLAARSGRLAGFRGSLWVYFGRRHPTASQLARANAELKSAKLP